MTIGAMDEWMERMCNSVHVPDAPDGSSVVGTIVVGAKVGVDVVGANVGVDVVGAKVGVDVVGARVGATVAQTHSHLRRCSAGAVGPTARYPEHPFRPCGAHTGTLESFVPARTLMLPRVPVEYPASPLSTDRVPPRVQQCIA